MTSPEKFRHQKAEEERDTVGDHFNNLFDQDEDVAGQKIDEATGKPIDNSSTVENLEEQLITVEPDSKSDDMLGKLPEPDDAAARWLREHGNSH